MASDVAVKGKTANNILNGNIVTLPTLGGAANFKDNNVNTGPTDDLGSAPADTDLETMYGTRFDDISYYNEVPA